VDLISVVGHNKNMMKKTKAPENQYDRELAGKGLKRALFCEPVEGGGSCYRERVVPINYGADSGSILKKKGRARMNVDTSVVADVEAAVGAMIRQSREKKAVKAPRVGSKLAQAIEIVKAVGKDDKEQCLKGIIEGLQVKRGNATIYLAKAKEVLG